jgi:hypothetical protein
MIRFTDIAELKAVLNALNIEKPKESHSAYGCVLVEQPEARVTKFTTVEPKSGSYEKYVYHKTSSSYGVVDVKFMVGLDELTKLIDTFSKAGADSVSIEESHGQLVLLADSYSLFDGTIDFKSCNTLRLFTEHEKFVPIAPISDEPHLVCTIPEELFTIMVNTVYQFSEFTEKVGRIDANLVRTAAFDIQDDRLTIYASNKFSHNLTIKVSKPVSQPDNTQRHTLIIEGRQLTKLSSKLASPGSTINIYADDNYVTFIGNEGTTTVKRQEVPTRFDKILVPILQGKELHDVAVRAVNILGFHSALIYQETRDNFADTELLILEENTELCICPMTRLNNIDKAKVTLDQTYAADDEWQLYVYNHTAMDKALKTLKKLLSQIKVENTSYTLLLKQQAKIQMINDEGHYTWFLRLTLVQEPDVEILYIPKGPEYVEEKFKEA